MMTFEEILAEQGTLVFTNVGVSMMPLLRQRRDLLIINRKTEERLHLWDVPLFRRPDGKYVMHRVLWVCKDSYIMCGDNQWMPEFGVREEQILGVLVGVKRRGVEKNGQAAKESYLPVRSTPEHPHVPFGYRLYVFIWCFFFPIRAPWLFFWQHVCRYYYRIKHKLNR